MNLIRQLSKPAVEIGTSIISHGEVSPLSRGLLDLTVLVRNTRGDLAVYYTSVANQIVKL
jgi:hypothetical protein